MLYPAVSSTRGLPLLVPSASHIKAMHQQQQRFGADASVAIRAKILTVLVQAERATSLARRGFESVSLSKGMSGKHEKILPAEAAAGAGSDCACFLCGVPRGRGQRRI